MKILIVDDNWRVRELIKRLVGDLCDEVFECSDGESAIEAYTNHLPDWVLMDIEMQGIDGLAASAQIRVLHPQAQVLIVTNYDDDQLRKEARKIGVSNYVLKENLSVLRKILTAG
jgi:CheY-like chemotaxis protein